MKFKFDNPVWVAGLWVVALIAGVRLAGNHTSFAGSRVGEHVPVVLTPKADSKTEPGRWTFAPEVPPPIERSEQRRVVVNWTIKESQAEIAPASSTTTTEDSKVKCPARCFACAKAIWSRFI